MSVGKIEECLNNPHKDCGFSNEGLVSKIEEIASYKSVPHCCFPEIVKHKYIFSASYSEDMEYNFYSSEEVFKKSSSGHTHHDVYFYDLCDFFERNSLKVAKFSNGKSTFVIEGQEFDKLVEIARKVKESVKISNEFEEVELTEGQEIIFSTPNPDLPEEFLSYMGDTLAPLEGIKEVYVFETTMPNDHISSLVIGIVPENTAKEDEVDKIVFLLMEGIEKHIEDREQVDFMTLTDPELIDIAKSVSPIISLNR
jgi:hypothetical protein